MEKNLPSVSNGNTNGWKKNIISLKKLSLTCFVGVFVFLVGMVQTSIGQSQTFSTSGTSTFAVPASATSVKVEAWGAGGGGGVASSLNRAGGGGGAYASSIVPVTPGSSYPVSVGAGGGAGVAGGNSSFNTAFVVAIGGSGASGSTGGNGGTGSTGTIKWAGGKGGNSSSVNKDGGAGGGGSAFTTVDGNPGGVVRNSSSGGAGGTGTGSGGNGGANGASGASGNVPGGGGGGKGDGNFGTSGSGAAGQVKISWSTIISFTPTSACANSGAPVTITGTNLSGATAVTFNGVNAASFSVVNSTTISAVLPASATTGLIVVTTPSGTATSTTFTVNPVPATVTVSGSGTFCGSATLTASNGSDGTIYFQGTTSNGTSTTTPATSQTVTSSGTYYFRAQSAAGCWGNQGSATVTINAAPAITIQPSTATQTVCQNSPATALSVTATGNGLTYQWYQNTTASNTGGTAITGATATSYASSTSTSGILYYYVIVSGTCIPAVTSNQSGAITVNAAPAITSQPSTTPQNVCQNNPATALSVTATGAGLTYQWYKNTTSSNTGGTLITGATTASYTPVTSATGTLYYYVVVSGTCTPAVTSNPSGAITVNAPPAIITQPSTANQTVCQNSLATTLSVTATGAGLTYQWYQNSTASNSGGTLLTGATASSYTPITTTTGTLYYYVIVSGTCPPSATSNMSGAVIVNAPPTAIISYDGSPYCSNAGTATVTRSGSTGGTYSSTTGLSITATSGDVNLSASTPGTYTVTYTIAASGGCSAFSTITSITVNPSPQGSLTGNGTICSGGTATLTFSSTAGTGPFTVVYNDGNQNYTQNNVTSGTTFDAGDNPILATTTYTLVSVTDNNGCARTSGFTGGSATITVTQAPVINSQPRDTTLCASKPVSFTVSATGDGLTYQWYRNNVIVTNTSKNISGATTNTLKFKNANVADNGAKYKVVVSGTSPCSPVTSAEATLNVDQSISITQDPKDTTVCTGSPVTFTVAAGSGTDVLTYQWRKDGADISATGNPSAITSSLKLDSVSSSDAGDYDVVISGITNFACPDVTSAAATLTVNPNATIVLTSGSGTNTQTACINTPVTNITYNVSGATGATFAGLPSGVNGSYNSGVVTISGTPGASGTFNFTVTPTGGCGNAVATGTITVNPNATITRTSAAATTTQSICINTAITNITYSVGAGGTGAGVTGLPAGLTSNFAGSTFTISGTPTESGSFSYTVTTTGGCGAATATGTITVNTTATITRTSAAATTTQSICINTAITNIIYSVDAGGTGAGVTGLPAGLTSNFAGGTFTISGTPTESGSFPYTVTTTGGCGAATASGNITVNPIPVGGTIASSQIVCKGSTPADLVLNGKTGNIMEWQKASDPNFVTTITHIAVTSTTLSGSTIGALPTTSYFRAVVQNGGCSSAFSTVANIAVNPPFVPVITASPSNTICLGQSINLATEGFRTRDTLAGGTFDSPDPAGWTGQKGNANNNNTYVDIIWGYTNGGKSYGGSTYNSNDNTSFMVVNGNVKSKLATSPFSTVGRTSLSLEWYEAYKFNNGAAGAVEISIDGGATYTSLVQYPNGSSQVPTNPFTTKKVIDLSAYISQPNVIIRFNYTGTTSSTSTWAIDNVNIIGPYQPVTYTWPSGFTPSATGNSATITPTTSGLKSYVISTTTGNCASTDTTINVQVNALPTITPASSATSKCFSSAAQNTTLSYTATNSPTTYSITWNASPANSFATVTNTALPASAVTITIPANTKPGTYTGTITATNANNCSTASGTPFTVTINPVPVVTDTILVSCNSVPFNVSPQNQPSGTIYSWATPTYTGSVTGGHSNTNQTLISDSLTLTGTTSGTAKYRVTPATSTCIGTNFTVTVTVTANTWNGITSNWNDANNWCSGVPTATTDVVIPSGLVSPYFYPKLSAASVARSIEIQSGATISLDSNILTVYGDISGTGKFISDRNASLVLNGTSTRGTMYFDQTKDTITNVLKDLTINTTATVNVGSNLYIIHELAVNKGTLNINTGDTLTLRSTSIANTARVAPVGTSAVINGDVTVERFIPKRRAYRFISPSVTTTTSIKDNWMEGGVNTDIYAIVNPRPGFGTNITGRNPTTNGFDATITTNPSLYQFNSRTQKFDTVPNTNGKLKAGEAYSILIRGNRSTNMTTNTPDTTNTVLRATGKLFTGDTSFALSNTKNNYTFIGNPYASPVDFGKMLQNSPNVNPSYYVWDPRLNTRGAYVSYNVVNNQKSNLASDISKDIQPGQAVFVQTKSDGSASIDFKEDYKSTGNTRVFGRDPARISKLSIQLLLSENEAPGNSADGAVSFFSKDFSTGLGDEDSYKFTNSDENLAINRNGISLSIEGRPTVAADDTIPLKIWQFRQKSYYLKLAASNFSPELTAFVKDAYLHKETPVDLSSVTLFPFTIDTVPASSAKDRFSIVFKPGTSTPVNITNVKANLKDEGIQVDWTAEAETNIESYEVEKSTDGQTFNKVTGVTAKGNNAAAQMYSWLDENPNTGSNYYRIKVIEKSGMIKYSNVVKVNVANVNSSITVFPNPIKGNVIQVRLSNMEKGRYSVVLYNTLGQKLYSSTIDHINRSGTYTISVGRLISKGTYTLHVSKGDIIVNERVIVE